MTLDASSVALGQLVLGKGGEGAGGGPALLVSLFGKTVLTVTRTREEVQSGKRRAGKGRALIWVKEGEEFYPQRQSGATFTTEGTDYVDYAVLAPAAAEWMFKVEHRIVEKYEVGPFRFELRPRYVIYKSPVMTGGRAIQNSWQSSVVK